MVGIDVSFQKIYNLLYSMLSSVEAKTSGSQSLLADKNPNKIIVVSECFDGAESRF
jgi:hypothetical protein